MIPLLVLLAIASPFLLMALFVDDWSRDLTTNRAVTSAEDKNPARRPLRVSTDWQLVREAVDDFCKSAPEWELSDSVALPDDSPLQRLIKEAGPTNETLHLVRTTRWMRYQDDVWIVSAGELEKEVTLYAASRSRLGKGDLGQNPRNLVELMSGLREILAE